MNILQWLPPNRVLPGVLSETYGFVDIDLPLTRISGSATSPVYDCLGRIGETTVGFSISLDDTWREQGLEGTDATFFWGNGALRSLGAPSNNLITLLALKYGDESYAGRPMLERVGAHVVCLAGNPAVVPRENLKMKFFFKTGNERRYAEVFINLDFDSAVGQLHEKDPEYRWSLLHSLTEALHTPKDVP